MQSKRPTILQIIPELDTGGAELSTIEIAEAITQAGGRALVVSEGGRMAARIEASGGEFIPFAAATKNPLHILFNAGRLAKIIRNENVDLVHARSRAPAWSAFLAARRTQTAFVTTYHGAYREQTRLKRWYNSVMASGDLTIANSKYTAKLVQDRYGTPSKKLSVIYRGLDGSKFDPAAISKQRMADLVKDWNIVGEPQIILQTARLTHWKGQRIVIDAARQLRDQGKLNNVVVIIAGDDQGRLTYANELTLQIREAGLSDVVRLVGHVADIPAALALADVAVVPSIEPEAFGRAATEAQAMGCPVIASNIGAPPETVLAEPAVARDRITGWLVPPSDPAALADALCECLALQPDERSALGARARRHVLENFSLDAMRLRTLQAYDGILGTQLSAARAANIAGAK